jgi:hypothetical protein
MNYDILQIAPTFLEGAKKLHAILSGVTIVCAHNHSIPCFARETPYALLADVCAHGGSKFSANRLGYMG